MPRPDLACLILLCLAAGARADPLPAMAGDWTGGGWARQRTDGPQETLRCRLGNRYDAEQRRLSIAGTCAVPGRKLKIEGMIAGAGGDKVRGYWSNPFGAGRTDVSGTIRGDDVYLVFRAPDPEGAGEISQLLRWRVTGQGVTLTSRDRGEGETPMAEIAFTR